MFFLKHESNFDIAQGTYLLVKGKKHTFQTKVSRTQKLPGQTKSVIELRKEPMSFMLLIAL